MMSTDPTPSPLTLTDLLSPLPAGARVLDLGCGGGSFDYSLFPDVEIHGVDALIPDDVDGFPPNVVFTQGDATAIPESDGVVDVLVANFAFEHFDDAGAAMREVERVLKVGGRAWLSVPNAASFEDQLYRNLYAGGGHLQRPRLESFLRVVYSNTSLRLVSYAVLPAGFTYLSDSEELRHLTWSLVDALYRTVGLDARRESNYVFVVERFEGAGVGFREYRRFCRSCNAMFELADDADATDAWTCDACAAENTMAPMLELADLDDVERGLRMQWERHPHTRPETVTQMMEERTRWAQELERQLTEAREAFEHVQTANVALQAEVDELRPLVGHPGRYVAHAWRALRRGR